MMSKYVRLFEKAHKSIWIDPIKSINIYLKLLDANSTDIEILHDLIYAYCMIEKYDQMLKYYYMYIKEERDEYRKYCVEGYVEYHLEKYNNALVAYQKAESKNREDWIVKNNIGYCWLKVQMYPEAKDIFRKSYRKQKNYFSIIGYLLSEMGMEIQPEKKVIEIIKNVDEEIASLLWNIFITNQWNKKNAKKIIERIK